MSGRRTLRLKLKALLVVIMVTYIFTSVGINLNFLSSKHDEVDNSNAKLPPVAAPKKDVIRDSRNLPPLARRKNILVNSYMRGGSSFLGRLLGYHPDSFYIYEPLWKYDIWTYYSQSTSQCNSKDCICWPTGTAATMISKLKSMVSCEGFHNVVVAKMTAFYSGLPWVNFTTCIHKNPQQRAKISNADQIPIHCLKKMQHDCLKYRHTVSKILRLTVDMYDVLLNSTTDTKVIHLFRDPRAVINSRLKTKWYPVKTLSDVTPNAKCLCERMLSDYEAGLILEKAYPDKFTFVFYEDLVDDLVPKTDSLYVFGGIRPIKSIGAKTFDVMANFGYKSDHSLRDNSTDYASWWRQSLDWEIVKAVDSVCQKVYTALGYKRFETEASLRDRNLHSFSFPERYQL